MTDRRIRLSWFFLAMGILILGSTLGMTCKKRNQPPDAPSIPSGPASGRKGDSLSFSTVAEDPDGDSVAVRFDWGDSTMSDWSKLVPSGDSVVMTHAWQRLAAYSIRAQTRDATETASAWSGEHQLTVASFTATFGETGDDEGRSVQQTADGGYIITGCTTSKGAGGTDVWLVKTDASGNKVWDKTFGGSDGDIGNSVQQTSDGGYVIAGSTRSYGAGYDDVWLIKTDASGNETWDKTFGGADYDEGLSVQQTSDGGYIISGQTDSYGAGYYDLWLIKTDAEGDAVWDRVLGGTAGESGQSVQQTWDGGYIITGYTSSYGSGGGDVWLVKTNALGFKVWDRAFGGKGDDEGRAVQETSDGGYIITGYTSSDRANYDDVWLIKTDASGNGVWDKTFGGAGYDEGNSVQQTTDGGYIITGSTMLSGTNPYYVWLIKTDSSGDKAWDRTSGGRGDDEGYSVRQTSDGGYIVTGFGTQQDADWPDVLLIKTDANGN